MNINKSFLSATLIGATSFVGGSVMNINEAMAQSPFVNNSSKFQEPKFDQITLETYKSAFENGMKVQNAIVKKIIANKEKPNFQNTTLAFEYSDTALAQVSNVFFNMTSANTNDALEAMSEEIAPILSKHSDDISLNPALFAKIKAVYNDSKTNKTLTAEQKRLIEKQYKSFVRSGANLNAKDQARLREVNQKLSLASLKFGQNVLAETNNFELVITNADELKGLPESAIAAAKANAESKGLKNAYRFTLSNASVTPFLQYAENRSLREKIYKAYINRANNNNEFDNKQVVKDLANLRAEKANLLGYKTHAAYSLEETMAKDAKTVNDLLEKLWTPALNVAKQEAKIMTEMMHRDGVKGKLEAWDWQYYANKVKKEKYALDEEVLKQYFEINNVREGIFTLTKKLYGITYRQNTEVAVYHDEATAWDVIDKDGKVLGLLYMDMYARPSKRGGAWMTSFKDQSYKNNERVLPVISIVCNFPAPVNNEPVLLTPDEVETFFHEFGHALHGLLSNVKYQSLAGTSVSRDFVELPSQVMEHWCFEPEMLALYAKNYKTGEVIPADLVKKLDEASKFNQGFATVEYLAASILDMKYHTIGKEQAIEDVEKFEKEQMEAIGLIPEIAPRYRSTYFQHIFSGGYSAGYYSYIWSEVLDSDAFATYKESGDIFNPKIAESFRKNILECGNTDEPMNLYKKFKGKTPDVKYLLQNRGLN